MMSLTPTPRPSLTHSRAQKGTPPPSATPELPRGAFIHTPLGAEVSFKRHRDATPERGFVRSRQFCSLIIEVVDMRGKPLRLDPSQYKAITQ